MLQRAPEGSEAAAVGSRLVGWDDLRTLIGGMQGRHVILFSTVYVPGQEPYDYIETGQAEVVAYGVLGDASTPSLLVSDAVCAGDTMPNAVDQQYNIWPLPRDQAEVTDMPGGNAIFWTGSVSRNDEIISTWCRVLFAVIDTPPDGGDY